MNPELELGISALVGVLVVPLTEQIKKWFGLENSIAKGLAALIVVAAATFGLNYLYGYGLDLQSLLRIAGAAFIGVITTNSIRKEIKRKHNGGNE